MRLFALAFIVMTLSFSSIAVAGPNSQLVSQVQHGLRSYGLNYDVSKMSTSTVTQLKFALSSTGPRTARELRAILRRAGYPE